MLSPPGTSYSRLHITLHYCLPFVHPFPQKLFPFANPCPLCALFHHYNMHLISLKTPKDNSYFINSALRDTWQRRGGKREWRGKWNEWGERERVAGELASGEFIHSMLCFPAVPTCKACSLKTPLLSSLWFCAQLQSVDRLPVMLCWDTSSYFLSKI